MEKSIYTAEHVVLVGLLRELRKEVGLTQVEVATRLERPQSFVAKYESGQRRLDLVELRAVAQALDTDLSAVVTEFLSRLGESDPTDD